MPTEGAHGYAAIRFRPNTPRQFFFRGCAIRPMPRLGATGPGRVLGIALH